MYTKSDLTRQIQNMNIDSQGTLLIHSSMKSIGEVEGKANTVLDAWIEYMAEGLLIFPTHTWKQMGTEKSIYDSRVEPVCVGVLPELFRNRSGVLRSLHPTHSVGALGFDALNYRQGEENSKTPCSRNGCWGKLYDRNAEILFLGCTLRSNTFIHGVEEWNNIPDRLSKDTHMFTLIDAQGKEYIVNQHRHHCSTGDISEHYGKLQKPFEKLGAIRYGIFGDADCIIGNAVKMADIASDFLQKNPNLFVDDEPIPSSWY